MKIEVKLTEEGVEYNEITSVNGFIDKDNKIIGVIKSLTQNDDLELSINIYKEEKNGK